MRPSDYIRYMNRYHPLSRPQDYFVPHTAETMSLTFHNLNIYVNVNFHDLMVRLKNKEILAISYYDVPQKSYRYHLFYSKGNAGIYSGALAEYVEWVSKITNEPVVIHVPKQCPELREDIKKALKDVSGWVMVSAKMNAKVVFYAVNPEEWIPHDHQSMGRPKYCIMSWTRDGEMKYQIVVRDKRGEKVI